MTHLNILSAVKVVKNLPVSEKYTVKRCSHHLKTTTREMQPRKTNLNETQYQNSSSVIMK